MATGKRIYRLLVVGSGDKICDLISEILPGNSYDAPLRARDAGEARRMLQDRTADVVVINTPLSDEFGTELALDIAEDPIGVILLVKNEVFDQVCYKVEDSGVLTVSKPITRQGFYEAIRMATALAARLGKMEKRNATLQEKMMDIRTVSRAKWLLIERNGMTEQDAHYFIEKKAMDSRKSRREVAEDIIRVYEN